jgi:type IV secretory pathway VirB2 component (pilin)
MLVIYFSELTVPAAFTLAYLMISFFGARLIKVRLDSRDKAFIVSNAIVLFASSFIPNIYLKTLVAFLGFMVNLLFYNKRSGGRGG